MICQIDGSHVTRLLYHSDWGAACQLMGTYRKGRVIGVGLLSFLFGRRRHSGNSSSSRHVSGLQSIHKKELAQLFKAGQELLYKLLGFVSMWPQAEQEAYFNIKTQHYGPQQCTSPWQRSRTAKTYPTKGPGFEFPLWWLAMLLFRYSINSLIAQGECHNYRREGSTLHVR